MTVQDFLNKLKANPESMEFNELMELIDSSYDFTPTAFKNGSLENVADQNSGSCKLFSFAKLQHLDKEETLACFGAYYRDDVLKNPEADNHQNIRNFMETEWDGVSFEGEALSEKPA